jgi:hypothetical protein
MSRLNRWLFLCRAYLRPLENDRVDVAPVGSISFRIASRDDLLEACKDPVLDLPPGPTLAALERGDLCVAAFANDKLVAYTWRAFKVTPHGRDIIVTFDPPCRYAYKSLTLPAYRGLHLQSAMSRLTDALCISRGYTLGISFIETHNYASIASSRRTGNRHIGYIGYLRVFDRVIPFRTPGAARYGFGFAPATR